MSDGLIPPAVRNALLGDPDWLLFDLLPQTREALWIRLDESALAAASFLDQRILPQATQKLKSPLQLLAEVDIHPAQQPLRWIFHCGHVGSTLLSRLLAVPHTRVLREPQVLRTLAQLQRDSEWPWSPWSPQDWWQQLAAPACAHLARPPQPSEPVLIKATSGTANLMPLAIEQRSQDRAIALAMPLDLYLAAMSRAEAGLRDVLGFAPSRVQTFCSWLQRNDITLWELSRKQILALSWLVNLWPMAAARQHDPSRCHWLDFAQLMEDPDTTVTDAATHLNWPGTHPADQQIHHYAKDPSQAFDAQRRWRQLTEMQAELRNEAHILMKWLADITEIRADIHAFVTDLQKIDRVNELND